MRLGIEILGWIFIVGGGFIVCGGRAGSEGGLGVGAFGALLLGMAWSGVLG